MDQLTQLAPIDPRPAVGQSAPKALSRRAKAAIIVQFLLAEGADVPLTALPDDMQADLTAQLGQMRYVDRATLHSVVTEFADELDSVGLSFPGGIEGALNALDGKLSPHTARRLRKEAGVRQLGDPWARIAALPPDRLEAMVVAEGIEIAAVMLSKIHVAKAAEVLGRIPGETARRITYAMSMTTQVTPDAVDRIGLSLASQLDAEPPRAFNATPNQRLGAILNYSDTQPRESLLQSLEEQDSTFAKAVRREIFTFANVPNRLKPIDVPKITRDVDHKVLITAFVSAETLGPDEQDAAEFMLRNMSKRMADMLRDDMQTLDTVRPKDGEAAMSVIVKAIRDMADAGEITLRPVEDIT